MYFSIPTNALLFLSFLLVLAVTAPPPSLTESPSQSAETSLSSPILLLNYLIRAMSISLEFKTLRDRRSQRINVEDWDTLVSNAKAAAVIRSHSAGGTDAIVRQPLLVGTAGLSIKVDPQTLQGGFTYGEMHFIILLLHSLGRNLHYLEFSCNIFRANEAGQRVKQLGIMTLKHDDRSYNAEISETEDTLGGNSTDTNAH